MTTATVAAGNRTMATVVRPRRSLEELVDQLFAAMGFKDETETTEPSPTRSIHEARRLRQAGDPVSSTGQALDGALAVFAGMDMAKATTREARWVYTRVEAAGEAAVRRPGRDGLPPGRRTGRHPGAHRRRRDT